MWQINDQSTAYEGKYVVCDGSECRGTFDTLAAAEEFAQELNRREADENIH